MAIAPILFEWTLIVIWMINHILRIRFTSAPPLIEKRNEIRHSIVSGVNVR